MHMHAPYNPFIHTHFAPMPVPKTYIHQDLHPHILKRLHVKPLVRFKCVCKRWKQLIDDDHSFALDHLALQTPLLTPPQNPKHTNFMQRLYLASPYSLDAFMNHTPTLPSHVHKFPILVNTMDGVVCFRNTGDTQQLFLWNPSVRRLLEIPVPRASPGRDGGWGFWMDACTTRFKIVAWVPPSKALVYSSESFEPCRGGPTKTNFGPPPEPWREVVDFGAVPYGVRIADGDFPRVVIGGVAYWRAVRNGVNAIDPLIVFFDFRQERLSPIELPDSLRHKKWYNMWPCKWQGSLAVVHLMRTHTPLHRRCGVWVMGDGAWSEMFRFEFKGEFVDSVSMAHSDGMKKPRFRKRVVASGSNGSGNAVEQFVLSDSEWSWHLPMQTGCSSMDSITFTSDFVESLVFPDSNWNSGD